MGAGGQWVPQLSTWVQARGPVQAGPQPLPVPQQHPVAAEGRRGGHGCCCGGAHGVLSTWRLSRGSVCLPLAGLSSVSPPCMGGSCCRLGGPEEFPRLAAFPCPLLPPPLREWAPFPILHPPPHPTALLPPQLGAPSPMELPKSEPFPLGPRCPPGLLGGHAMAGGGLMGEHPGEDGEEEEEEEADEGQRGTAMAQRVKLQLEGREKGSSRLSPTSFTPPQRAVPPQPPGWPLQPP